MTIKDLLTQLESGAAERRNELAHRHLIEREQHQKYYGYGLDEGTKIKHGFMFGHDSRNTEVSRLIAALRVAAEAISNSIARSDDYGDSYCSQPIRQAQSDIIKLLSGEAE